MRREAESVLRGRAMGCITRASALEGHIRSKYEAAGERGHSYEAMDGSTVLQDSVGALKRGRRSGLLLTSSLLAVQVARDMGPLPRIELERTTVEVAYDNHKTLERRLRLIKTDRRRLTSRRIYLVLLNLDGESMWLPRRDAVPRRFKGQRTAAENTHETHMACGGEMRLVGAR